MTGQFADKAFGRYLIDNLLGRGGMASVYRAHDPLFDRLVAIKVLNSTLASDPQYKERFQREARSMARLQHPHILPVYDVGEQEGFVYLVMPLVDGGSLHDRLIAQRRSGHLRLTAMLAILEPLAAALDYAHGRGVVHRDIKPHNILLTEQDYPFLTDFGIAKVLNQDGDTPAITMANAVIGTPEYMSPEQAQGLPLDGRADLYSFGVILYELFTGRTPFRVETASDTPIGILIRHAGTPPPAPSTINPQISPALEAVLLRTLAKRPEERYPSGAALFEALREALAAPGRASSRLDLPPVTRPELRIPPLPNLTPLPAANPAPPTYDPSADSATIMRPVSLAAVATPPPATYTPPPPPPLTPPPPASAQYQAVPPPFPPAPEARRRAPLGLIAGSAVLALAILGGIVLALQLRPGGGASPTTAAATATTAGTAVIAAQPPSAPPSPTGTVPGGPTAPASVAPSVPPAVVVPGGTPGTATRTPAGSVASPGAPARREVVLFSSHRNDVHDSQIYIMNPDGSGQRPLTSTRGHSWGPRISPDGKFFVFSSVAPGEHVDHSAGGGGIVGSGHHEIFRSNVDGSNIVRLTNTNSWNNAWAWAPDGQSLILASDRDGNWELYRMSAQGEQAGIVRLTNNPAQDGWPSFTPDGKQVIFASDREGGISQIYIMDADGKNARRLNFSESYDTLPDVSPDGKRIVYSAQNGTKQTGITSEIYVMNIDGSNATRLTSTVAANTDPSWSPDGKKIIFSSDRDGQTNLYIMNADGTGVKRLTNEPGEDITPFWGFIMVAADAPPAVARSFPAQGIDAAILPNEAARRRGAGRRALVA